MNNMPNSEYRKIHKHLTRIAQGKYCEVTLDWCADRVDWAWKWRKISQEEMEELASWISRLYDRETEWGRK